MKIYIKQILKTNTNNPLFKAMFFLILGSSMLLFMSFKEHHSQSYFQQLLQHMKQEMSYSFNRVQRYSVPNYSTNLPEHRQSILGLGDLVANVTTPWIAPDFTVTASSTRSPNILCTGLLCFTITNLNQVTDADETNFATVTFPTVSLSATASVRVTESVENYPGGLFAGFTIEKTGGLLNLGLFNDMTIRTYLNGTLQESKSGSSLLDVSLLGAGSPGKIDIGFWTDPTKNFDAVELFISPSVSANLGGSIRIYHAILEKAEAGTAPVCNGEAGVNWVKPNYPVRINSANTGANGLCVGCSIDGASNILDSDLSNFAEVEVLAGLLGGAVDIAVVDPLVASYDAGSFAGFVVQDQGALGLSLLDAFVIETYLDGVFRESATAAGLVDLPIFTSKNTVGFNTSLSFDEVRLRVVSLVGLLVNVRVYNSLLAPPGCIPIDSDNDSIIDLVEDAGPNNGDGNNDGILDKNQGSVASIEGQDGYYVTAEIVGGCDQIQYINTMLEDSLNELSVQYDFPFGLIDIEILCTVPGSATSVVYYWHATQDLTDLEYIKHGPLITGTTERDYYIFPASLTNVLIGGNQVVKSLMLLTDGLLGDDTVVDGVIKDPSGLAVNTFINPPQITNYNSAPSAALVYAENGLGTVIDWDATDPDGAVGLTFSLSGADALLFALNPLTGQLSFLLPPNYEMPLDAGGDNIYNVIVTVTDLTSRTDTQALAITIKDVDEDGDGYINGAEPDDNDPCNPDVSESACQIDCEAQAPTISNN